MYLRQISHFLKENLVESYTEDIRQVSGHLNVLASILKNDKSTDLCIILYNKALDAFLPSCMTGNDWALQLYHYLVQR